MSLQAELVRLGLRWFLKPREPKRAWRSSAVRFVPRPPTNTDSTLVDAGGILALRVSTPASQANRHILFVHGGGFVAGSPALYRHVTWRFAAAARASLFAITYRLAPEHPFPAALDDSMTAYRSLLSKGADPRHVAVMGDSAGANLVFAMLLKARDEGLPLPAAAVGLSPWVDLALQSPSIKRNAAADPMLNAADVPQLAESYLQGADPSTPYASPVYGDLRGLPPTLIQVGSDEILHDDAVRMAEKLRASGCHVELEVWPRMPHVWHLFATIMPEGRQAIARVGTFLNARL
jgi:acetyl esterase/lipase